MGCLFGIIAGIILFCISPWLFFLILLILIFAKLFFGGK